LQADAVSTKCAETATGVQFAASLQHELLAKHRRSCQPFRMLQQLMPVTQHSEVALVLIQR
jgi:hypothetical protein